jgi:hypothetical protein
LKKVERKGEAEREVEQGCMNHEEERESEKKKRENIWGKARGALYLRGKKSILL